MKNKILKILYDSLNTPLIDHNPFRSKKFLMLHDGFIEKYVSETEQDEAASRLDAICETCQKSAFELGFYTAVRLLRKI